MAVWTLWLFLLFLTELKAQDCGVAPLNTRIVGGENATAGHWPWQVSMHYKETHICGGTVISTQWVLTAAHCILSTSGSDYRLYFGKETQSGSNPHEVNRSVSQIIVHPDYNSTTFQNDIALMKLSNPITYTDYIRPVCLAANSSLFYNNTKCWATGWGRLSKDEPLVGYDRLQEVQIPVIRNNLCSCYYSYVQDSNITSNMLCAGELGKGVCQGDSGGPLQCKQGSQFIQAGLASFGIPCALGIPEVFTRISEFQSWITGQLAGTKVSFVKFTSNGTDPDSSIVCPVLNLNTTTAPSSELSFTALVSVILLLSLKLL
ncbi:chymotrypsin-like protease CTRL-1 isoform X2 [Boleophthalmus pectinirostris]|uniref:chymotrypsin-like protease CTRL-1 isoform X2 n=1 Tax=Boleophthalmus pectinirostris TaxID=150288 RepID=UPI000A1C2594|nr:chymotrypsin-like protease CTRL-1 isoform X2 [Boleophthalmus pectinirostris]